MEALELFCACATQWRRDLLGHQTGLDYAGVLAAAKMIGMEVDRVMLRKLQVLEIEVLGVKENSGHGTGAKPCRNAHACAMCTKNCNQRV